MADDPSPLGYQTSRRFESCLLVTYRSLQIREIELETDRTTAFQSFQFSTGPSS